jgi:hypothetical protein
MSGGSYNYAYSKIGELRGWASTLQSMADDCRERAASPGLQATRRVGAEWVDHPATMVDRATIMVKALLLESAARRLGAVAEDVQKLEGVMHDVEWVCSGDYGPGHLALPFNFEEGGG